MGLWYMFEPLEDSIRVEIDRDRHHPVPIDRSEVVYESKGRSVTFHWDENGDLLEIGVK